MSESKNSETALATGRREFIATAAASVALAAVGTLVTTGAAADESSGRVPPSLSQVRALVFDVFGTVVDWRTSIIREGQLLEKRKGERPISRSCSLEALIVGDVSLRTDSLGDVRVGSPNTTPLYARVRRIGFAPARVMIFPACGVVAPSTIVTVDPVATRLSTVTVSAARRTFAGQP